MILAANEQIARTLSKLPWSTGIVFDDLNTFLHNTQTQISFTVTSSMDLTIEVIKKDLDSKR